VRRTGPLTIDDAVVIIRLGSISRWGRWGWIAGHLSVLYNKSTAGMP
jgi:hypothetical protein